MAATQAENQPNEVNSDPVPRDHPTDLNNSGLQNGTDKNGGRGSIGSDSATVNAKAKSPGQGNHPEMSQYRPELSSAPPLPNSEPHANSVDNAGKIHDGKNPYLHPNDPGSIGQGDPGGPPIQSYYARGGYHHAPSEQNPQANSNDSIPQYNQYNSPQMRHGYGAGGKGMPMVSPRPPSAGSNYPPGPQRFLSGQSISQPTGPTPTLNQLLQSNQSPHYQNSYGDYAMKDQSYQQWGPQRPPTNYSPQVPGPTPYRNQHPGAIQAGASPRQGGQQQPPYYGSSGSNSAAPGPGSYPPQQPQPPQQQPQGSAPPPGHQGPPQPPQPSPGSQQYPPYPGRYPTPPGPPGRQPFPPHQMSMPYSNQQVGGPNSQQQPGYSDLPQPPQQQQPQPPPPQPQQQQQQQSQAQQQQQQQQPQQPPPQPQPQPQPPQRPTWPPQQQPIHHPPSPSQHQPPQPPQSPSHMPEQHPPPKPSPGPQASPSHPPPSSPQPSPQTVPPPSPHQQQAFPPRPQQSSTPNAHAPDQGELTGANSNDSNSGHAGPGTPNSGMRPTPSPTGSTGSRSMSPAVGQQNIPMPPRPSSGQSESGAPARLSHSPLTPAGPYPQPPHGAHPYKTPPHVPPYSQGQQYPQGNYSPRPGPQGMQYGPGPGQYPQPQPNNIPGGPGQYPGRPMTNHASHSQYSGYQGWGGPQGAPPAMMNQSAPPAMMPGPGNHLPPNGKGATSQQPTPPPNQSSAAPTGPRPHTPPHYLKHHLQQKMGFTGPGPGMPPSPGPPQNYPPGPGMGPPGSMHHHMGSQSPMGPPPPSGIHHPGMGPPPPQNMGPPVPPSSTPNSHIGQHEAGGMPPPSSTPNSHSVPHVEDSVAPHDNGITTTAVGPTTHVTPANLGSVTSVVTTGPDGAPLDEGSQQSTLSNASAASGEDPACTPGKSRKDFHSHPTTPQSTAPSPGAASVNSMHEDYDVNSSPTSWPRTPNSPVFNSHLPQDSYRTAKKPDSLGKLYEMDDSPERRHWLDRLLAFMEERGSPITACPTISKNPLDLFRLYIYVKDRGGFMEVTKNKTWKDIAGLLGIGASSSAAYTLRKHYTKNLLAYECHFDRGGIDPQPIINQVEAQSKKKGNKSASVPSPGSSNSQDSFPPVGGSGGSMDGYPGYGYPPGSTADYSGPNQRPAQTSAPSPHPGMQQGGYPGQGGYPSQYPDQYGRGQEYNQQYSQQGYPPSRSGPVYPQYPPPGPENDNRNYPQGGTATPPGPGGPAPGPPPPPTGASQDPYARNYQSNYTPGRPGYSTPPGPPGQPSTTAPTPGGYPPPPSQQQEYYRQDQMGQQCSYPVSQGSTYQTSQVSSYPNSQLARQLVAPQNAKSPYQNYGPSSGVTPGGSAPTAPGSTGPNNKTMPPPTGQPRRHPDFAKDQPPYQPYPQQRPGYGNWPNSQYRGQYPQQWSGPGPRPQWEPRYPPPTQGGPAPSPYPPPQPVQQWGNTMSVPGVGQSSPLRQAGPRIPYRPDGMTRLAGPPPAVARTPSTQSTSVVQQKKEIVFPPDSVEAVLPVLYKRRRLTKGDVTPLEAWRIMMALRSGQLCETTWALDVLNILLFDDTTVAYFGLSNLPGLLDILLEHWRKSLDDIFEPRPDNSDEIKGDVDLGEIVEPLPNESTKIFKSVPNFSMVTIKGKQVHVVSRKDLFIRDDRKSWDTEGEAGSEDESPDTAPAKYIISPFRGEVLTLPFARRLETVKKVKTESSETVVNNNIINNNNIKKEVEIKTEERLNQLKCKDKDKDDSKRNLVVDVKKNSDEQILESKDNEKGNNNNNNNNNNKKCEEESGDKANGGDGNNKVADGDDKGDDKENRTEKIEIKEEKTVEKPKLNIRDPQGILKRRRMSDCEDECYSRDESSLLLAGEAQDALARRCICLSTIIRNLSFVPGNEPEMARSGILLTVLGRLLLLHHEHPPRQTQQRNYDREEDADFADSCSSLQGENEWWWDYLHHIRENVLVTCANICGHMDLASHLEEISRPIIDGLLHWAVCPAAAGQDPFPTVGPSSSLSPQRLALEALCKLCVTDTNVDLLVATPPYSRLERLCAVLCRLLCRGEDQVLREFAVNLLHYLSAADSSVARTVALQTPCVSLLLSFIEQAEQSAIGVANQHGINALRDNPDAMGTSLDMLRRAAATLLHLSRHPDNRPLFVQQEARLLQLAMSQLLDQQVASVISRVLFQCSRTS